jgi:hypothetical protein
MELTKLQPLVPLPDYQKLEARLAKATELLIKIGMATDDERIKAWVKEFNEEVK